MGVLLTLHEPTKPMLEEAATEGDFICDFGTYPKIQILTIKDLFDKRRPQFPSQNAEATMKTTAGRRGAAEALSESLCF